jgi:hypothetical protein
MPDIIDDANDRMQMQLDASIAAARNNVPHEIGPEECACGEAMPFVRRQLGYQNCISCAAHAERLRDIYRGRP